MNERERESKNERTLLSGVIYIDAFCNKNLIFHENFHKKKFMMIKSCFSEYKNQCRANDIYSDKRFVVEGRI